MSTYQDNRYQGNEHMGHGMSYPAPGPVRSHYGQGYVQPYAHPAAYNPNNNRSQSHYDRGDRSVNQSRDYSRHGYYPPGHQQNGGHGYPLHPEHGGQALYPPAANFYQQGLHNSYGTYQQHGTVSSNWSGGGRSPQANNPNMGRGYNHPRHSGNQFSALDRGTHRRPPHSEHHRR